MRVKLNVPSGAPLFETTFQLGVADMNYGNHLGNDRVLTLAHETRIRFMAQYLETELTFCGSALIMADAAIQYKGQGFIGDLVQANLWLDDVTPYGFDFFIQLTKKDKDKVLEVARLKTAMLFFDYKQNKIAKTPSIFRERFC